VYATGRAARRLVIIRVSCSRTLARGRGFPALGLRFEMPADAAQHPLR
jgi:hypothetical protein